MAHKDLHVLVQTHAVTQVVHGALGLGKDVLALFILPFAVNVQSQHLVVQFCLDTKRSQQLLVDRTSKVSIDRCQCRIRSLVSRSVWIRIDRGEGGVVVPAQFSFLAQQLPHKGRAIDAAVCLLQKAGVDPDQIRHFLNDTLDFFGVQHVSHGQPPRQVVPGKGFGLLEHRFQILFAIVVHSLFVVPRRSGVGRKRLEKVGQVVVVPREGVDLEGGRDEDGTIQTNPVAILQPTGELGDAISAVTLPSDKNRRFPPTVLGKESADKLSERVEVFVNVPELGVLLGSLAFLLVCLFGLFGLVESPAETRPDRVDKDQIGKPKPRLVIVDHAGGRRGELAMGSELDALGPRSTHVHVGRGRTRSAVKDKGEGS
mmetsp:Transcript_7634/g.8672  ORF Transcript_7634/g.8672 Transcript_7634/m.8672 type:complete len:371 (+) Transcript_7634:1850-2962(+)